MLTDLLVSLGLETTLTFFFFDLLCLLILHFLQHHCHRFLVHLRLKSGLNLTFI